MAQGTGKNSRRFTLLAEIAAVLAPEVETQGDAEPMRVIAALAGLADRRLLRFAAHRLEQLFARPLEFRGSVAQRDLFDPRARPFSPRFEPPWLPVTWYSSGPKLRMGSMI